MHMIITTINILSNFIEIYSIKQDNIFSRECMEALLFMLKLWCNTSFKLSLHVTASLISNHEILNG